MILTLIQNFLPLFSIYSFQKSAGVTTYMFRAVAKVMSLILTVAHTVLLEGGDSLVGSVCMRASCMCSGGSCRLPCSSLHCLLLLSLIT